MVAQETDLFGVPWSKSEVARETSKAKRKPTQPRGYIMPPGSGPAGETCGTCQHIVGRGTRYLKCKLNESRWTHGPGSDIRARSKACKKWEKAGVEAIPR